MADPDLLDFNMDYLTIDEDQYRTVTSLSSYISRGSVDNLDEVSSRVTGGILKFEFEAGGCEEVWLKLTLFKEMFTQREEEREEKERERDIQFTAMSCWFHSSIM